MTRAARSAPFAILAFAGLSVVVTWPLAGDLSRNVPSDYGDPLYAAWAIAWVSHQVGRALTGHLDALVHFWDANQFHPEPATLALSDHFVAQALPVAPVYWLSHNPILTLNLAYLLAFTLSGFATFLLIRELTGSAVAGFAGGVVLPFNVFTLYFELAHLQVISTGWMPLSLYALRRYFTTGSRRPLIGAGVCLVMSNLSAGYYLLMFPPFVALYCAWEITARHAWRDRRMLIELAALAVAAGLISFPFIWPYVQAQRRYGFSRTVAEAAAMGASVDSYVASMGRLGIAWALAAAALVAGAVSRGPRRSHSTEPAQPLLGFFAVAAVMAFWLSLGPVPSWGGASYPSLGLYAILQPLWPGMNAVRVSSRFASVFLVFFAVLTGMGAALIARVRRPPGALVVLLLGVVLVGTNAHWPFKMNEELSSAYVNPPGAYLRPSPSPPTVYRYVASLPGRVVLAEFPFGDLWYSTRYLYFSTFHWRPMLNGFTSFFPPSFTERLRWLTNPSRNPDEAFRALLDGGTTHVVLHTGAWDDATTDALVNLFESRGAKRHGRFDDALVYELPQK